MPIAMSQNPSRSQHRKRTGPISSLVWKTSRHSLTSDILPVSPQLYDKRCGPDQGYQKKGVDQSEKRKVAVGAQSESNNIYNQNARRTQRLRSDRLLFSLQHNAAYQQPHS